MDFSSIDSEEAEKGSDVTNMGYTKTTSYSTANPDLATYQIKNSQLLGLKELIIVFRKDRLETKDLLNFRLVSSLWREAATTVLLERDACQLSFGLKCLPASSNNLMSTTIAVHCNEYNPNFLLKDLNELIRNSVMFPSISLRLVNCDTDNPHLKVNDRELLKFFSAYGSKIKTLSVGDGASTKELRDLLLTHTPNLECLDLRFLSTIINSNGINPKHFLVDLAFRSTGGFALLPLKTLRIDSFLNNMSAYESKVVILKELLGSSPKLEAVQDVHMWNLKFLLEEGKTHLIKDLDYYLSEEEVNEEIELIRQIISAPRPPKLVRLAMDFSQLCGQVEVYAKVVAALNTIIESNKESLEILEMLVNPHDFPTNIKIPPLKNLKCIRITATNEPFENPLQEMDLNRVFEFEKKVKDNLYFPKLREVELNSVEAVNVENSLLRFFLYEPNNPDLGDSFPTVETLEMHESIWPNISDAILMAKLFPRIKRLQIEVQHDYTSHLNNSLWKLCPLAESIEIYGFSSDNEAEARDFAVVDSFFTGFSNKLCSQLYEKELPLGDGCTPELIQSWRVLPSLCDLKQLKNLNLELGKLSSTFASRISGVYAFQMMPQTRVTVSYDTDEHTKDTEKYLAPVAPFVVLAPSAPGGNN